MKLRYIYFTTHTKFLILTLVITTGLLCKSPIPDDHHLSIEPYEFITYSGDTISAELGQFNVIENREDRNEKLIELSFVRFPSTSSSPGYPIVYLAGGPGGSGINAVRGSRSELFMSLREVADVIAFDQRATGLSSPFEYEECEISFQRPPGKPLPHDSLTSLSLQAAQHCAEYWRSHGIDLNAYNTVESAADLEDLRKVLGSDKLNLLAISYGTHLGLTFIRNFSHSVNRAILAGVEGPDHTVKLPEYSENQLEKLYQLTAQDDEMLKEFPDLKGLINSTLNQLESNPVTIEYQPPGSSSSESVVVGRPELERLTISLLRDPSTMVTIPSLYQRINKGDYLALATSSEIGFEMEAMEEAMDAASGMSEDRRKLFLNQARNTTLGGGHQSLLQGA